MYNKNVDWEAFDDEDNEMIDLGMSLLESYLVKKPIRPNPDFIRSMFIDEFEGFEEVEGDVKNAIVVKAMQRWEELHPDEAAKTKKNETEPIVIDLDAKAASGPQPKDIDFADFPPATLVKVDTRWEGREKPVSYCGVVLIQEDDRLVVTYDNPDPNGKMLAWVDIIAKDEVISITKIEPSFPGPIPLTFGKEVKKAAALVRDFENGGYGEPSEELLEMLGLVQMKAGLIGLDEQGHMEQTADGDGHEDHLANWLEKSGEREEKYDEIISKGGSLPERLQEMFGLFENFMQEWEWDGEDRAEGENTPVAELYGAMDRLFAAEGVPEDAVRRSYDWSWGLYDGGAAAVNVTVAWMDDDGLHQEKVHAETAY